MQPNIFFRLMTIFCLTAMSGCGGGEYPELAQVSGVVTLDGSPLANATVEFQPQAGGRASLGTTDESGFYELFYVAGVTGAVPGTHSVYVYVESDVSDEPEPAEDESAPEEASAIPPSFVPASYGHPQDGDDVFGDETASVTDTDDSESRLSARVDAGDNKLDFQLKTED